MEKQSKRKFKPMKGKVPELKSKQDKTDAKKLKDSLTSANRAEEGDRAIMSKKGYKKGGKVKKGC
jgi:hypothetical protein